MEKELFDSIMRGAKEASDYMKGKNKNVVVHVPKKVNVKKIRKKLCMTQKAFAETFGFSLQSIKYWESDRREPETAAKVLLNTIAYSPETVILANR